MQKIQFIYSGSLIGLMIIILIINTIRQKLNRHAQVIPMSESPKKVNFVSKLQKIDIKQEIKLSAIKEANQIDEYSGNKQIARREKLFQRKDKQNTILPFTLAREKPRKSSIQILEDGSSIKTYDIPKPKRSRRNSINSLQIQSQNLEEFFSSPTISPKSQPESEIQPKHQYLKHLLIYKCIKKNNLIGLVQFINRNAVLSIVYEYVDNYIIIIVVGSLIVNRLIDKVIRRQQKKKSLYKYLIVTTLAIFMVLEIFNILYVEFRIEYAIVFVIDLLAIDMIIILAYMIKY